MTGRFALTATADLVHCPLPLPSPLAGRARIWNFVRIATLDWAAANRRRTVMRWWTIPILGAVAFSLTIPAPANARMRLGPGAVLGAFGAMFGGRRPSIGHHRRSAATSERGRARDSAPSSRDSAPSSETATSEAPRAADKERAEAFALSTLPSFPASWDGPVFWPHAADDMFDYAFLPNGIGERFWAHGTILLGLLTDAGAPRKPPAPTAAAERNLGAADATGSVPQPPTDPCGSARAESAPDGVVARIARKVEPSAQQREGLEYLRTALARASDLIKASCRASVPTTPPERLAAMQDRIWAMRDAVLTIHIPLENFYNSLDQDQRGRLKALDPDATTGQAGDGLESASACNVAGAVPDMRGIERILRPTKAQRVSLQELQMRLA